MEANSTLRILFFPWLAHGHVFPFLELAKRLSNQNFKIYFCSTSINLEAIKDHSSDNSSIEFVELNLPYIQELPPQYHTTKNIPPNLMSTLMQAFQMSSSHFADIFDNLKPDLLIYDGFQPWAAKLAAFKGIPAVMFCTSGATATSFFHHLHTHKSFDTYPYPDVYLRGYEKMEVLALGESITVEDVGEGFGFGMFELSKEIVLTKTCSCFEGKYIDYLSELCGKRIIPVGPLMVHNYEGESSNILNWLSKKDECSTLYISFGSENYLSKNQIEEIAKGLELSKVDFIWVLRFPVGSGDSVKDALPEGFLDQVIGRGIVESGWVPQVDILAHRSIGGFMSHCGWGSVVESIYFGVPILGVPLKLDQPVNSRAVVEVGVGLEVQRDENGRFDGEGVAKAIRNVIVEKSSEGFRCKAKELGEKMKIEEEEIFGVVGKQLSRLCVKN